MATRKSALWVPERAEIIFIQYSLAVGEEMPDDLPMLVISTKFCRTTFEPLGLPKVVEMKMQSRSSPSKAPWASLRGSARDGVAMRLAFSVRPTAQ